jgi:hypothetical protein
MRKVPTEIPACGRCGYEAVGICFSPKGELLRDSTNCQFGIKYLSQQEQLLPAAIDGRLTDKGFEKAPEPVTMAS